MFNPTNPDKNSGSYVDLRRRVFQRVRSGGVNDRILEVMQMAFADAIEAEGVVLAQVEKKRLQAQVLKQVLDEMSKGLEAGG